MNVCRCEMILDLFPLQFPVEYEERVIRLIHHSSARLEELVNKIYEDLRPEEPGDKENGTKKVPKHPLPRSVLRRWVQEVGGKFSNDSLHM